MQNKTPVVRLISLKKILIPEIVRRKWSDSEQFNDLCVSVRKKGILYPIIVRRKNAKGYELVKGGRRIQAAQTVGLEVIPSIIQNLDDTEMLLVRLTMHQRQEKLSVFDEALLFARLLDKINLSELAKRQGVSPKTISERIKLLSVCDYTQREVFYGKISLTHAIAMVEAKFNEEQQRKQTDMIIKHGLSAKEFATSIRTSCGKKKISLHIRSLSGKSIEARMQDMTDYLSVIAEDVHLRGIDEKKLIKRMAGEIKTLATEIMTNIQNDERRPTNGKNHQEIRT